MKVNAKLKTVQVFQVDGKQFATAKQAQAYQKQQDQIKKNNIFLAPIQQFVTRLQQLKNTGHELWYDKFILGDFYVEEQIYFGQPYVNIDQSEQAPAQQFFSCDSENITQKDYDKFLKFKSKVKAYKITRTEVEI